jgi:hypothetical protein
MMHQWLMEKQYKIADIFFGAKTVKLISGANLVAKIENCGRVAQYQRQMAFLLSEAWSSPRAAASDGRNARSRTNDL